VSADLHLHALSEKIKPEKLAKQIETRDKDKQADNDDANWIAQQSAGNT